MRVNRARLGLALLMLPTFLVALDTTALLLALPRLSASLGADSVEQLWISDSYGFTVAGLVITMGTLGDRIGRRRCCCWPARRGSRCCRPQPRSRPARGASGAGPAAGSLSGRPAGS